MKFENYNYVVRIGKIKFTAECNYGGLKACQKFIKDFGEADKPYKIRVVKKEAK